MDKEQEVPALGTVKPPTFNETLANLVATEAEYKKFKAAMEDAKDRLAVLKSYAMSEFERMGIDQIKTQGRTIYVSHQIWAGNAEHASGASVADELKELGLDEFISYNHMSFSSYVRETARQHAELVNNNGEIIGSPEEILAVLPGNLANLCRITSKADISIRKSNS